MSGPLLETLFVPPLGTTAVEIAARQYEETPVKELEWLYVLMKEETVSRNTLNLRP